MLYETLRQFIHTLIDRAYSLIIDLSEVEFPSELNDSLAVPSHCGQSAESVSIRRTRQIDDLTCGGVKLRR